MTGIVESGKFNKIHARAWAINSFWLVDKTNNISSTPNIDFLKRVKWRLCPDVRVLHFNLSGENNNKPTIFVLPVPGAGGPQISLTVLWCWHSLRPMQLTIASCCQSFKLEELIMVSSNSKYFKNYFSTYFFI